jgi:uncharacterized protein (DUF2147 family)
LSSETANVLGIALAMTIPAASPMIDGRWITQDRTAVVTIAPCASGLCGTVTRVLAHAANVPTTDVNNPDARLRSRPLVGLQILSGFRKQGVVWKGGLAYDPKSGRAYKASLTLNPGGTLTVTGCLFIICRSQRWTRVGG